MNKKELIIKIKELYPYYTSINKYKKKELEEILNHECINFTLSNENNSCYMDSILIALFNSKNKKIFNYYINSSINNYNNDKLNSIENNIKKNLLII